MADRQQHLVAVHVQLGQLREHTQLVKGAHCSGQREAIDSLGQGHVLPGLLVQFQDVPLDEELGIVQVTLLAGQTVGLKQEGGGVGALVGRRGHCVQMGGDSQSFVPYAHVVGGGIQGVGGNGVKEEAGRGGLWRE